MVGDEDSEPGERVGASRSHEAYQLLSSTFIDLDTGDTRFLQSLSRIIFGPSRGITLTIPHFWALVHLDPADGRTMVELAQLLLCDKSNVTAIVDKLEERGWALRVRGKKLDRRYTSVVLTDEGRALRAHVIRAHEEWVRMRLTGLTDEQLAQLTFLLQLVHSGLRIDPESAAREVTTHLLHLPSGVAARGVSGSSHARSQRKPAGE